MTELYTTAGTSYFGVEYATNQNNNAHRAIHQPCACIYGTTTPIHFWQALQAANVADGSLARFLILQSEEDFPDSNREFGRIDSPPALIQKLQLIQRGGGKLDGNLADVGGVEEVTVEPRIVRLSDSAAATFERLDLDLLGQLRDSKGTGHTSILARVEENATKLALIRAVSRDPVDPYIKGEDASWGILLARHCAEQTIREVSLRVSENPTESFHKRALLMLQSAGASGMTKREFTRRTQYMDLHQRDNIIKTLVEADLVSLEIRQARGRPTQLLKAK